jgi:two-component system response regulator
LPEAVHVAESVDDASRYIETAGSEGNGQSHLLPKLILLDLKLPGKGGLHFLEWLRQRPETRYLPVVILTSSTNQNDIIGAYQRGANSYTIKPVSLDDFVPMVRTVVHYWGSLNRLPE